jgi:signal peptidase II
MSEIRRLVTKVTLLAVVATTIGCDQVSKHLATVHLAGVPRQSFLGDSLRLEYAENSGAFLSLGAGLSPWARTALFVVGTGIILVACVVAAIRHRWPALRLLGLALVFAGGISNLVDRIARGAVIDFMNVGVGSLRTGIFNVADMAIMLGVALLVFRHRQRVDPVEGAEQAPPR